MLFLQKAIDVVTDSIPTVKEELSMMKTLPFDDLMDQLVSKLVRFGINLAIALMVFYIGRFIIKKIHGLLRNIFTHRHVDASLATFLLSMVRIVLYFILIVTVIGILGIETSSFIALFASAGVALGMALSGTLQNFAGGVLILLLKPYKVGDYIEAQGFAGTVREIQIFSTVINTPDNKSILIPNGALSTSSINNWSREEYRRIDWTVSISYGDDVTVASKAILEILNADPLIVDRYIEDESPEGGQPVSDGEKVADSSQEGTAPAGERSGWMARILRRRHRHGNGHAPAGVLAAGNSGAAKAVGIAARVDRSPVVVLDSMAASSVDLKARAWVRSADYWTVYYRINEQLYTQLPSAGVNFPFPQMDVHIVKDLKEEHESVQI